MKLNNIRTTKYPITVQNYLVLSFYFSSLLMYSTVIASADFS